MRQRLNGERTERAGVIADELLSLICGVPEARLRASLEIEVDFPGGAS